MEYHLPRGPMALQPPPIPNLISPNNTSPLPISGERHNIPSLPRTSSHMPHKKPRLANELSAIPLRRSTEDMSAHIHSGGGVGGGGGGGGGGAFYHNSPPLYRHPSQLHDNPYHLSHPQLSFEFPPSRLNSAPRSVPYPGRSPQYDLPQGMYNQLLRQYPQHYHPSTQPPGASPHMQTNTDLFVALLDEQRQQSQGGQGQFTAGLDWPTHAPRDGGKCKFHFIWPFLSIN